MKITHYDDHRPERAAAYPSVGEQLDAIWKFIEQSGVAMPVQTAEMLERIKAVKERFPKSPNVK
jgi:hypothetical protein